MVKINDITDFGPQFRAIRYMRPHIEKLSGQIRFAILEKSDSTLEMRKALKVGLDESIEAELVLYKTWLELAERWTTTSMAMTKSTDFQT